MALLNRASGVASTPYQGFQGEETAPINSQQQAGIGNINDISGVNSPFISQISASGQPISASDIQRYQDPYTNQVINATQADFDTQNQRANSTVTGNAAAQGALGGDRVGVAQALTQEGQARVQAPVIAGLRSSGYQQAVNTAENQQQQALRAGVSGQQAAQSAAGAQIGAGTLQQSTQQAHDTQARQDYYQQQGYPFQVAQWLAGIDTSVGGSMGSSSTSSGSATSQGPTPNPWTQAAGLGLTAASMFVRDGGRITGKRAGFAAGGSPYGDAQTWVPTASLSAHAPTAHAQLPSAPQAPKQQGLSQDQMKGIGTLGKAGVGLFDSASYGGGNFLTDAYGGNSSSPLDGLTAADYGPGYHGGGQVRRGFADGGMPDFDERFDAAYPNMTAGMGASKPAFDVGPTYDDGGGPMRLSAPEDLDAWRGRVDRDNGRKISAAATDQGMPAPTMVASAPDEVPSLPSEVTAGVSRPRMTASAVHPDSADEEPEALGYAGQPALKAGVGRPQDLSVPEQQGGILSSLGIKMTPELRTGLMQAGLSMMATTRGGPGSFLAGLGEAGMTGVGAYSKSQQEALKQDQLQREQAIEAEKLRMTQETHQQQMAASPLIQRDGKTIVNPAYVKKLEAEENVKSYKPQLVHHADPATGEEQYFTYDPNTKKMAPVEIPTTGEAKESGRYVSQAAPVTERRKAPAASPEARDEGYIEWLNSHRPPGYSDLVRGVADYEMDPNRVASLQKGQREQLYRDVKTFDPTYDQTHFAEKSGVINSFSRGADRAAVNSLNVSVSHLGTLQKLGDALNNGDKPLINKIANQIAIQMGRPAPVNFDAAKEIVGDEVVKAVVGGVNSQADREAVKHLIMAQQSPAQLKGVIQTFISLLGGQLEGRRQGYQAGTGLNNFDQKYLSPETQEALKASSGAAGSSEVMRAVYPSGMPKPGATAATEKPKPSQADIDYARSHPEVKDKFKARFGVEP